MTSISERWRAILENNTNDVKETAVVPAEGSEAPVAEEKKKSFSGSLKEMWNKVAGGVSNTIEKAGNTFEANRIREELRQLDLETDSLYRKIGERIYRSAEETFSKDDFRDILEEISSNYEKQKDLLLKEVMVTSKPDDKEE